jgi:hypothetical protein
MLVNNRQWVFDSVHPQYTIGLTAICKRKTHEGVIALMGPFAGLERFRAGIVRPPSTFTATQVCGWTDTASLPLLPTEESLEVFAQIRKTPRLDFNDGKSGRARPHTELHATSDKELIDLKSADQPTGFWPIFKGESFDIWAPDTGEYYGWACPADVLPALQQTRIRGARNRKSVFAEFEWQAIADAKTLPCRFPRIAFRDVSRATDSRTVRAALIPPNVFLVHLSPYFTFLRGNNEDGAYLIGVLSSIPLDWYARRFVETPLTYAVLNPFPIPRPRPKDHCRQRLIRLAGRLGAPDDRFSEWAEAVRVECGPIPEAEKQDHIHELDAVVAHLYGLKEKHLVHIFETFHEGWDYGERLKETLHYRQWKGKTP